MTTAVDATLWGRVTLFGRMIRFSHSIFALPFALASASLAFSADGSVLGQRLGALAWIVVAMVGARSAAMGFNRLVDHEIDARNPRTRERELPAGKLARRHVWWFVGLSGAVFVLAAFRLNRLCGLLSPVALAIVFVYSYAKRFTALSHVVLGLALAVGPVGAWLAIRERFDVVPLVLGSAVVLWVAGFDVIYACQDAEFDVGEGLHSAPARLGVRRALALSRLAHGIAVVLLASVYWVVPLHPVYLGGVAVVTALLAYEHSLVRHDDLSRVDAAFFAINGWVSVAYLGATLAAVALAG